MKQGLMSRIWATLYGRHAKKKTKYLDLHIRDASRIIAGSIYEIPLKDVTPAQITDVLRYYNTYVYMDDSPEVDIYSASKVAYYAGDTVTYASPITNPEGRFWDIINHIIDKD